MSDVRRPNEPASPTLQAGASSTDVEEARLLALLDAAVDVVQAAGATRAMVAERLTTLTARVREVPPPRDRDDPSVPSLVEAQRLIQTWSTDADFLDASGTPRVLPLVGREATFQALVKRSGGFATSEEALTLLLRHAAAEREGDFVRLRYRTFFIDPVRPETRAWAVHLGTAALRTLAGNIAKGPDQAASRRFERVVNSDRFPTAERAALRARFTRQIEPLLVKVDQDLKFAEERAAETGEPTEGVGYWVVEVDLANPSPPSGSASDAASRRRKR